MDFLVTSFFLCMNAAENKTFINLILWFKKKLHNYCTVYMYMYIHWTVHFKLILSCMSLTFFSYFLLAVTSTTCASRHLQCPSHPSSPCLVLVITMWSIMKAPLNTTCLVLLLSQQLVDGQGEFLERRTHRGQVRYITDCSNN